MSYILAHDLGTLGNKANLFHETGERVASHFEAYPVAYPQAQWAEQNPDGWWRAGCVSTRAFASNSQRARKHCGVSCSGQMMGVLAVAVVGGIGVGLYKDWNIANTNARVTRVIAPNQERAARFDQVYRALEPHMK